MHLGFGDGLFQGFLYRDEFPKAMAVPQIYWAFSKLN